MSHFIGFENRVGRETRTKGIILFGLILMQIIDKTVQTESVHHSGQNNAVTDIVSGECKWWLR